MEIRELKALISLMRENGLVELEVEDKKGKVRLVRAASDGAAGLAAPVHQEAAAAKPGVKVPPTPGGRKIQGKTAAPSVGQSPPGTVELKENQKLVESPMVGTFYRAASPESEPFVEEGSQVHKGQPLCIIEAMKMMNEIEADTAGRVARILVENGQPVQYGQPLMILEVG